MRKSIKRILKEQLSNRDKLEELQDIWLELNEGYSQLEESWGFDDASQGLEEYFETGGVTINLRNAQKSLKNVYELISLAQEEASEAIGFIIDEIESIKPSANDTSVGKSGMDDHLRGGGAMGAL
jgi:hypothetical protein